MNNNIINKMGKQPQPQQQQTKKELQLNMGFWKWILGSLMVLG